MATTPWLRRTQNGVYFGRLGQVWMYYEFPLTPLQWEDAPRRLQVGAALDNLLTEVGQTSRDIGGGLKILSRNREVHLMSIQYDSAVQAPDGTPERLQTFLDEVLVPVAPDKSLLVGVRLRSAAFAQLARAAKGNFVGQAKSMLSTGDSEDSFDAYKEDFDLVDGILRRNGCRPPTPLAMSQLESWFNYGRGADVPVAAADTTIHVTGGGSYELAAVMDFTKPVMNAPAAQWLLDATTHPEGAVVVSVRAELTPPKVVENMLRSSQRKLRAQEEEEAKTGDIGRDDHASKFSFAREAENFVREARQSWLTEASILFARHASEADDTYLDMLRTEYGVEAKPLEKRQIQALDEMQPCSTQRVNPFPQVVNPAMVAYAGLPAFSNIGDRVGVWMGQVDPDFRPMFLHPFGAPEANLPPIMGVFGDPGSGTTFACQLLGAQAALATVPVIMVNPKPRDSLADFAEWVGEQGAPYRVVSLSKLEAEGGAFDPFRFCEPQMAAEILTRHILTVMGKGEGGISGADEILLGEGLARGAEAGARCALDALAHVKDERIRELVLMQARASTLFSLAIGTTPREKWADTEGLTLIEFDREIPLPPAGKAASEFEREERIATAAMRLVTRASLEILMANGGGVLIVDEAHHYLGSSEGLASLQRIGREGRSMNLLPVFATQRVSDLLSADMQGYMSRVLAMKLNDPKEAAAALTLCKLEPTEERISFLSDAGPKRPVEGIPGRGALGFFKDLQDRHSVITIGPIPEDVRMAFSTNPEDRRRRKAAKEAALAAQSEAPTVTA